MSQSHCHILHSIFEDVPTNWLELSSPVLLTFLTHGRFICSTCFYFSPKLMPVCLKKSVKSRLRCYFKSSAGQEWWLLIEGLLFPPSISPQSDEGRLDLVLCPWQMSSHDMPKMSTQDEGWMGGEISSRVANNNSIMEVWDKHVIKYYNPLSFSHSKSTFQSIWSHIHFIHYLHTCHIHINWFYITLYFVSVWK